MANLKATHQKTKRHNRDLVLKTIFARQPISRAEIALTLSLPKVWLKKLAWDLRLAENLPFCSRSWLIHVI